MITQDQITTIKQCWARVTSTQQEAAFIDAFYQSLFSRFPSYRRLFPSNTQHLSIKLLETLNQVINGLEHFEYLESFIIDLGTRHQSLKVTPEMYQGVTDSTLIALSTVLDRLTEEEKNCWTEAFKLISKTMISGYR